MKEYIMKREKRLLFYRRTFIGLFVFIVTSIIIRRLIWAFPVSTFGLIVYLSAFFCTLALGFINFVFSIEYKSIRWIRKNYDIDFLENGINLDSRPTLPDSRIYCGNYAFASVGKGRGRTKAITLIPYDAARWVYKSKVYVARGLKESFSSFNVLCDEGVHFAIGASDSEISYLLSNYIIKFSHTVVIGYGKEQKKRYIQGLSKIQRIAYCVKSFFNVE
ncbi:hypothetical protein [uncultured Mailhella sp.]|uniref:hypothetical protein n=1 Tax=uncultured Mailhella sp. TaxID=1981031 RepID=UPI002634F23F|nr:hypothetical protein [uncultured Mailhella sp.]